MKKTRSLLAGILLSVCLWAGPAGADPQAIVPKVSRPLAYSGYSSPQFKGSKIFSKYVEMSDGTKLAVDVCVPTQGPPQKKFPVILLYTPYQRATIDPETGRVNDLSNFPLAQFFLSYGYVMVAADMRGNGASTSWYMDFMPEIGEEGKELVDWIAAQPWCNGNVGMAGGSYLGWSQTATASHMPHALKCIMPEVIPLDGYTGEIYPGGIYLQGFLKGFSKFMDRIHRNIYERNGGSRPTKPVVDEDGDGELADEIPLDLNGDGSFLDEPYPPVYRDGKPRRNLYFEATRDHERGDLDYAAWASKLSFIDAFTPLRCTVYQLSPSAHVPGLMRSHIPIYNIGGWFDAFTRGSFELFSTLRNTNPSKLIITPGYHNTTGGPYWKYLGEDGTVVRKQLLLEHLRFFDRYLKGIQNGIDKEPPIYLYVMNGGGWRFENEWPLARQVLTRWYFDDGHQLVRKRSRDGQDAYHADFTHSSTYGANKGNRWNGIGGTAPASLPIRTEKDRQCLVYSSAPLDKDTEVTGHPTIEFWVSSTADYGDFFAYLEDVDQGGQAVLVTEAQLRAGFAGLHNNNKMIAAGAYGIDVRPELPWHGFEKADYVARILAGGRIVKMLIDFQPTSWVFKKAHRIRVSIACADWPTFRLNPKLCPNNTPVDKANIVPTITVHHSQEYPSNIELPVIPPR